MQEEGEEEQSKAAFSSSHVNLTRRSSPQAHTHAHDLFTASAPFSNSTGTTGNKDEGGNRYAAVDLSSSVDKDRGVVVVGFVGTRPATPVAAHHHHDHQIINRIIDANIFGSGGKDVPLHCSPRHRISYYYADRDGDDDKGILFLHLVDSLSVSSSDDSLEEEQEDGIESEHLRGMLFMFSVCHVIVFLHEGRRFDTDILKMLRMLQAAKHALSPFIRSQVTPSASLPKLSPSQPQPYVPKTNTSVSSAGRRNSCHSSSISLMSGSTSRSSALPGHCVPVILFVFHDDFYDGQSPSPNTDDPSQPCSGNSGTQKSSLNLKGSGSVVMLARPATKTEGCFKKKLNSSLDAQIRFLIKKCRILGGTDPNSRGIGTSPTLPLFSLDVSKVVVLLDSSMSQRSEPLDFISSLIEDTFNSKRDLDDFMFGNQGQSSNHEEIQMIKDFICRQADILRRRGGLPNNANSGSVAGVGMVAAAAAAAAASTATRKPISSPELPSLEYWLSSSTLIINALLSVDRGFVDESGNIKGSSLQSSFIDTQKEYKDQNRTSVAEAAVSCLQSSASLNMRFSVSWCKRVLPAAKEVYLKDLPPYYPSSLHNAHLEKALNTLRSAVKGPALQTFTKKLEDECNDIWTSGRQLCDAISLTGKPCMHQRHAVPGCGSLLSNVEIEHSSGYFFLHACACGRSRRLREDPFDFDSANVNFNCFPNCEDVIPTVVLPKGSNVSPLPPTSWRLLLLGGARYYEPSKGLIQIGFCSRENFMLQWIISVDKQKGMDALAASVTIDSSVVSSTQDRRDSIKCEEIKNCDNGNFLAEIQPGGANRKKPVEFVSSVNTNISFGKGLPSFTMKKPFSEVVAGSVPMDPAFPNLKFNKQQKVAPTKGGKQTAAVDQTDGRVHEAVDHQDSQRNEHIKAHESLERPATSYQTNSSPFLQIGSNLVPVNMCDNGNVLPNSSRKQVIVYVGFEHECSYGHRFFLSPKHLMGFDSSYPSEASERKHVKSSNVLHEEVLPFSNKQTSAGNNSCRSNGSAKTLVTRNQQQDESSSFCREGNGKFHSVPGLSISSDTTEDLGGKGDDDCASSLLNRNLPIYMNCPHCKSSTKQNHQDIKFASTVSQLQRIFLVTIFSLCSLCLKATYSDLYYYCIHRAPTSHTVLFIYIFTLLMDFLITF